MTSITESVSTFNSFIRTILLVLFLGVFGYGGYAGYEYLIKPQIEEAQATDRELAEANRKLVEAGRELASAQAKVNEQTQTIAQQSTTITEQAEEITLLETENEKLETARRLLKVDHRLAKIRVINVGMNTETNEPFSDVEFTEVDEDGKVLGEPNTFRLMGDDIRVDSWIVKFDDQYVEQADLIRGTSLCVFKSIYGNLDGPQNDYLLSVQSDYPGRFFFHALPNFFNRDEVVSESRNLFERGFRGLKLCGGHLLRKVDLDDEVFFPLWELMESEGYVLSVDFSEGEIQVPQFEIILSKFPSLKVAIGHFGMPNRGGWPGQLNLCHHENVYMECGGIIWLYRSEGYPFNQALETIKKAASEVGYSKLMWGSDWPRTMVDFTYRQSLDFIREDDSIDECDKELFLGINVENLYGLKLENLNSPTLLITEG